MKKTFTLFGILFIFTTTINSQIIHVPADQPSIQEGIEAASEGDTVLVANGTYLENINFMGKAITVASNFIIDNDTNHISNTIIDGSEHDDPDFGSVVTFDSGEDTTSVLCGFTVTGGTGTKVPGFNAWSGGGIQCYPAGAKILSNKIINNTINTTGGGYGAGILCDTENTGWLVICNNTVQDNEITAVNEAIGCGICAFGNARIENNIVINNISNALNDVANGGIACNGIFYDPSPKEIILTNNYIESNHAYSQSNTTDGGRNGGLYVAGYYGIVKKNSILNNSVSAVDGIQCYGAGFFSARNSDELVVESNIISGNYYTSGNCVGGGLCIWYSGGLYQNNVIQNNEGHFGGGISIAFNEEEGMAVIMNNTTTGNTGTYGGGLYLYESEAVVVNSIFWNNEAEEGPEIFELDSDLEVRHSNVEGGWPGNGNIDIDPLFRSDGYHLDVWSTMLNEGTSSILINGEWYDCPEYDIDGDERPFSSEPEIGADEAMWNSIDIGETVKEELTFSVYPNPASSIVNFSVETDQLPQQTELTLYNSFGEIVQYFKVNNGVSSIPVHQMPAGIYLIKCKTGGQEIIKRLVIIR